MGNFIKKVITQFPGEKKIGERLAKLRAKWLIVSYAPFALDFCSQWCRTRQISKITSVLRTETVSGSYVNRQINVSLLSANINLLISEILVQGCYSFQFFT